MKTRLDWDYTSLADAYVHRPSYSSAALDEIARLPGLGHGAPALDLGAGMGHLSVGLAERGLDVLALEPNDCMRAHGLRRTRDYPNVRWIDALMEETGLDDESFALASYGSSFGVVDVQVTLREAARVLRRDGWLVCLWNHRNLEDPLQKRIEASIRAAISDYRYGMRRQDPTPVIEASGLFGRTRRVEASTNHFVSVDAWLEAWRSHATLQRQARGRFPEILREIGDIVRSVASDTMVVPYTTRMWIAPRTG